MKFIITAILTALATLATALPVLSDTTPVITETKRDKGPAWLFDGPRQDPDEEEDECHKNWAFLCD